MTRASAVAATSQVVLTLALTAASCTDRVDVGYDSSTTGGNPSAGTTSGGTLPIGGGSGAGAGGAAGTPSLECQPATCRGRTYACGNCTDDDGDGAIDALDAECLGACDDSEEVFASGSPVAANCRLDCAFDRNSGAGNDRCGWDLRCDELSPGVAAGCEGDPVTAASDACIESAANQPDACIESCTPLTPNGCDCFGCCELPARSGRFVWIGGEASQATGCTLDRLDDESACPPCTQVPVCKNPCEQCEACVGGAEPSASCGDPAPQCGVGVPHCGAGAACPSDRYCVTGCCIFVPT